MDSMYSKILAGVGDFTGFSAFLARREGAVFSFDRVRRLKLLVFGELRNLALSIWRFCRYELKGMVDPG